MTPTTPASTAASRAAVVRSGVLDLPSGGEALLLAESLSVPDFVGVMNDVKNGEINTQAR